MTSKPTFPNPFRFTNPGWRLKTTNAESKIEGMQNTMAKTRLRSQLLHFMSFFQQCCNNSNRKLLFETSQGDNLVISLFQPQNVSVEAESWEMVIYMLWLFLF